MNTSTQRLAPHRAAVALGGLCGLWHLAWSALVLLGLAKPVLDLVLALHFLEVTYTVAPFSAPKALGLVVMTSALGYLLGYVLVWVWNRLGAARPTPAAPVRIEKQGLTL